MSKFRALVVSSLLAAALVGGAATTQGADEAKAPISLRDGGTSWCC